MIDRGSSAQLQHIAKHRQSKLALASPRSFSSRSFVERNHLLRRSPRNATRTDLQLAFESRALPPAHSLNSCKVNTVTQRLRNPLKPQTPPFTMAQPAQVPTDTPTSYNDPTFSLLNSTCLDLLLIELVPMAYRITADLALREEEWTGTSTTKANRLSSHSNDASSTIAGAAAGTIGAGGTATVDEEESREAVFHRLESLGYRVGLGIVERYVCPADNPRIPRPTRNEL